MEEEKDINALQQLINVFTDIVSETGRNLEDDGKISKTELIGYADNLVPLVQALANSPEAVEEIKAGIDSEETSILVSGIKEHFDITDDELESIIEKDILGGVVNTVKGILSVGKGVKALKNR